MHSTVAAESDGGNGTDSADAAWSSFSKAKMAAVDMSSDYVVLLVDLARQNAMKSFDAGHFEVRYLPISLSIEKTFLIFAVWIGCQWVVE